MSGGVWNITVDGCVFGTDGSDFAGVHFKAPRGRGGSVHAIRVLNSAFHLETSVKQPMPFSASMFYGASHCPLPSALCSQESQSLNSNCNSSAQAAFLHRIR